MPRVLWEHQFPPLAQFVPGAVNSPVSRQASPHMGWTWQWSAPTTGEGTFWGMGCDGVAYRSARSVRDWDVMRQRFLAGLEDILRLEQELVARPCQGYLTDKGQGRHAGAVGRAGPIREHATAIRGRGHLGMRCNQPEMPVSRRTRVFRAGNNRRRPCVCQGDSQRQAAYRTPLRCGAEGRSQLRRDCCTWNTQR